MSSLLSVLVNKEPASSAINLYLADPKTIKVVLNGYDKGCSAFIETIADLDNAHFMTKFEMQALVTKLTGTVFRFPPRDRLEAAKALSKALSEKQRELPMAHLPSTTELPSRICMPQPTITPCKRGTKLALLVELLIKGTTMEEMMREMKQKQGGVLSSLNWDLVHRKGFGSRIVVKDGVEHYSLVLPPNFSGPLII